MMMVMRLWSSSTKPSLWPRFGLGSPMQMLVLLFLGWSLLLGCGCYAKFEDVVVEDDMDEIDDGYDDAEFRQFVAQENWKKKQSPITKIEHARRQIEWVQSKGGFVSSKIEIRPMPTSSSSTTNDDGNDNNDDAPLGVFAVQDIEEGDLIFSIPKECLVTGHPSEDYDWICPTVHRVVEEMTLGSRSAYAPYMDYLDSQPYGQLPSMWSLAGQELLLQVTGGSHDADDQVLPPLGPVGWLDDEWRRECHGGDDVLEQHIFLMIIQRGWDDILVPLYELLNHRNGKWLNTASNSIRRSGPQEPVQVTASKKIKAGDEIYGSYTHCTDCGGRVEDYGTPEILRDYGFVEPYPRKFVFDDRNVVFTVDRYVLDGDDDDDDNVGDEHYQHDHDEDLFLIWHSDEELDEDDVEFFEEQLERLERLYNSYMRYPHEDIPAHELQVVRDFTMAYIKAMGVLLDVVHGAACAVDASTANGDGDGTTTSFSPPTCSISSSRYSDLDEVYEDYDAVTCDKRVSLDFSNYETLDEVQSHYQLATYIQHPVNKNTCFDLDDIYQICGSYRPHYHEMVVHYTARFLPKIRRVLWVGGGDSMLLHEIIKYPDLEFVLGLELDQKVTRWAFKHFGSQPHWDNDKVQWWYGDAAKSLLMLPKEYFGTFDMVLVDLSETVMSALVTKDLDIMAALSLLLQPDGILVKNELYFEKLNPIFKHTIQLHYKDVPVICSQCLCLGSNGLDFIHRKLTNHKVDTMFALLENVDYDYLKVHDYLKNPSAQRRCSSDEEEEEPEEQESSPGIIMVVEAENVSAAFLEPSNKLQDTLVPAIEAEGLSVMSAVASDESDGAALVIVLREGYIVARTWPRHQYCAFDIHFWSRFEKQAVIKTSLVAALEGSTRGTSSFRIVAGGMFGVSTWKEDYQQRGPKFTQDCSEPAETESTIPMDQELVEQIVGEVLNMKHWENVVAAVVCGPKEVDCPSLDLASKHASVRKTIPLYTCDIIKGNIDLLEDSANLKYACENELYQFLNQTITADEKISILILDQSAPFAMAQVVNKLVKPKKHKKQFFLENIQVTAPLLDKSETWRRYFVDGFRMTREPGFMGGMLFNDTTSSLEVATFLSNDDHFIVNMKDLQKDVEAKTSVTGEIRSIGGATFNFQPNFKASQWFLPGDYDQREPYKQWHSQQPTGHQSVFQLEHEENSTQLLTNDFIKSLLSRTLTEMKVQTSQSLKEFSGLGDGCVIVAFLAGGLGHIVLLFDGRNHISLNVFTYQESVFAAAFSENFLDNENSLNIALFDEMPRGYGRVVNFLKDIIPRQEPHWALHMLQK